MSGDWRLRVDLHEDGPAHALTEHLGQSTLEHDLDTSFHGRVVVSREGAGIFFYTGTREQAQEAKTLVHAVAADLGWHVDSDLMRWHPSAEQWKDANEQGVEPDAKDAAIVMREREALEQYGHPEFEVGVHCSSHLEGLQLLETLRREGLPCVRRSEYLLIGAPDEEAADALAKRLGREAPSQCVVIAKETLRANSTGRPVNPFSVLMGSQPGPTGS